MPSATLICPQCGAPLPRHAAWRPVACVYCGAQVGKTDTLVRAADFRAAYLRGQGTVDGADLVGDTQRYRPLQLLATGVNARIVLADRVGALPERVILKIAHAPDPARLRRELAVLMALQADGAPGAAYFSQRLPQPIAVTATHDAAGRPGAMLVLRNPSGYWGSLADVQRRYRHGVEARHVVWMWRRVLEMLGYVHGLGWTHGNVEPAHMLIQPADHGVQLIGWAGARHWPDAGAGADKTGLADAVARDLAQSAWAMRAVLDGDGAASGADPPALGAAVPASLADLLQRASEERRWLDGMTAQRLNQLVADAAGSAFGAPLFIHFNPAPPGIHKET